MAIKCNTLQKCVEVLFTRSILLDITEDKTCCSKDLLSLTLMEFYPIFLKVFKINYCSSNFWSKSEDNQRQYSRCIEKTNQYNVNVISRSQGEFTCVFPTEKKSHHQQQRSHEYNSPQQREEINGLTDGRMSVCVKETLNMFSSSRTLKHTTHAQT